jgi:hypothetical protein
MTLHAAGPFLGRVMEVMLPRAVFAGHVAAVAKGIPIHVYFSAVGFMAILADHPGLVHLALEKGGIDIYLILDLSVGEIQSLIQQ